MKTKMSKEEILTALAHEIGSMQNYKNALLHFEYTSGIYNMWNMCEAYWLLTAIASYRRKEQFQIWELKVNHETNKAVLTMCEDSGESYKVMQTIPFTDFPLDELKMYCIDGMLMLTSEY